MLLKDYFILHGLQLKDGLCLTVASDGLKFDRDNPMALSVGNTLRVGSEDEATLYLQGAAAAQVERFTGVSPRYYQERAVGIPRLIEILAPLEEGTKFLVMYSASNYTGKWLKKILPEGHPFLSLVQIDVLQLARAVEAVVPLPEDIPELDDLTRVKHPLDFVEALQYALIGGRAGEITDAEGGSRLRYNVEEVLARMAPLSDLPDPRPLLERKIGHLRRLWQELLYKAV